MRSKFSCACLRSLWAFFASLSMGFGYFSFLLLYTERLRR